MSRLKINFFYNSLLAISQVIFPMITFPYVARVLNPEGIGAVSFVDSIAKYFMLIGALGIPIYGVREIAKVKNSDVKQSILFSELLFVHLFITVIVLILYFTLMFSVNKLIIYHSFLLLGAVGIVSNVFVVEWYFQGIEKFKFITTRNLVIRLFSTLAIFLCIRGSGDSYKYYLIINLVVLLNAIINFKFAIKHVKINFRLDIKKIVSSHLGPLMFIFVSLAFISIYTLLDIIILGFLTNNNSVGVYSTAVKFAKIPIILIGALSTVLLPKLSEFYGQGNEFDFRNLIEKSLRFVYFVSAPILFLVYSLSDEIILAFLGENYINSIILLKGFSILSLLLGVSNIFGFQILTTISKDKYFTICVGAGMLSSIIFNFVLIPYLDVKGAMLANVLSEILVSCLTYFYAIKFVQFNLDVKYLIKQLFISIPILIIAIIIKMYIENNLYRIELVMFSSFIYLYIVQYLLFKDDIVVEINRFIKNIYGRI